MLTFPRSQPAGEHPWGLAQHRLRDARLDTDPSELIDCAMRAMRSVCLSDFGSWARGSRPAGSVVFSGSAGTVSFTCVPSAAQWGLPAGWPPFLRVFSVPRPECCFSDTPLSPPFLGQLVVDLFPLLCEWFFSLGHSPPLRCFMFGVNNTYGWLGPCLFREEFASQALSSFLP